MVKNSGSLTKLLFYWLPPVALMALIFYLSSRQKVVITHEFIVDFLIFKSLHMIEYALLFFLLFRAINGNHPHMPLARKLAISFAIAVLYGASDELHQTFVPTREGRVRDVFIDAAGALVMYSYIKTQFKRIPKILL